MGRASGQVRLVVAAALLGFAVLLGGAAGAGAHAPRPSLNVSSLPADVQVGQVVAVRVSVGRSLGGGRRIAVSLLFTHGRRSLTIGHLRTSRSGKAHGREAIPARAAGGRWRLTACVRAPQGKRKCTNSRGTVTVLPPAPVVHIADPTAGETISDQTPPISGTAGVASGDASTVSVRIYSGSAASGPAVQTLTAARDAGGHWTAGASTLPVGTYTAIASQGGPGGTTGTSAPVTFASPAVMLAAGDIASCSQDGDSQTATVLAATPADLVATLGDEAYENGSASDFQNCYDPTWGFVRSKTAPAPGNHEYQTNGASGYFGYFGAAAGDPAKGYYSYDLGSWHVIVLNSNSACTTISCAAGSPQEQWLQADLAAHPAQCTLAYWHHPLFSSDNESTAGPHPEVKPFWDDLYAAGADLVLNGHSHIYERFRPQTPDGAPDDARGIREIIAGTGGYQEHTVSNPPAANSESLNHDTFGVLRLVLRPGGYSWRFLPVAGKTFTDAGSGSCH